MLVLSRKIGEKILIGDDVEVVVLSTKGRGVRLGIEAPKTVKVLRSELTKTEGCDHAEKAA